MQFVVVHKVVESFIFAFYCSLQSSQRKNGVLLKAVPAMYVVKPTI